MPDDIEAASIPTGDVGAPARRTPTGAGYTTLEQRAEIERATVGDLHGVGPSALETLRQALDAHDLSFREAE